MAAPSYGGPEPLEHLTSTCSFCSLWIIGLCCLNVGHIQGVSFSLSIFLILFYCGNVQRHFLNVGDKSTSFPSI